MARILDKDTRLIDADFGPLSISLLRDAISQTPTAVTSGLNGEKQLIRFENNPGGGAIGASGSFVQYTRIDLEYMTMNNEVMQPVEVNVQRTSAIPTGTHENGNNFQTLEEVIYILSRPLNNEEIANGTAVFSADNLMNLGLDRSQSILQLGGSSTGIPTHEQTIYAEKRTYVYNGQTEASINNGQIATPNPELNTIFSDPMLVDLTTWGTLSAITGPSLHCYRVVTMKPQTFTAGADVFTNVGLGGFTTLRWPAVNVTFLCKDPNYTEGEYLTRLANAMNNIPEDGPTA